MSRSKEKCTEFVRKLPSFFRGLLWFMDFDKIDVLRDRESILYQVLGKGRMEHIRYAEGLYGKEEILKFAKRNLVDAKDIPDEFARKIIEKGEIWIGAEK